jgi:ABC-2 type transport system ATP-binding protein
MGALRVQELRKSFGAVVALAGVSLELREGELLGLLGPNGAGKTTLVRCIAGRLSPDSGSVEVLGRRCAPGEHRPGLGVVPQEIALYPLLTARENLEVFGRFNGMKPPGLRHKVDEALEWTGLVDRADQRVKTFSGGMRRRLNIACGVIHEPRVVLLDEPTVGVDPQSRERIYEMLAGLRAKGTGLLLTTHHLEEAEAHCERIVIVDHGRLVADGTLAELFEKTVGRKRMVMLRLDAPPAQPIAGFETDGGGTLRAPVANLGAELPALVARVEAAGRRVEDVEVRGPSLQSVFIQLTGRELRE